MVRDINHPNMAEISETDKPVDIVQELIAILTTRAEAATRLKPFALNTLNASVADESTNWVRQLTEELSDFGDAVQPIANRENKYQQAWIVALANLDEQSRTGNEEEWQKMEALLKEHYKHILSKEDVLPASLVKMIRQQDKDINDPVAG